MPNTQAESRRIKANSQITRVRITITGANNIFKRNFIVIVTIDYLSAIDIKSLHLNRLLIFISIINHAKS
mgnify:CR=1 FL=1